MTSRLFFFEFICVWLLITFNFKTLFSVLLNKPIYNIFIGHSNHFQKSCQTTYDMKFKWITREATGKKKKFRYKLVLYTQIEIVWLRFFIRLQAKTQEFFFISLNNTKKMSMVCNRKQKNNNRQQTLKMSLIINWLSFWNLSELFYSAKLWIHIFLFKYHNQPT